MKIAEITVDYLRHSGGDIDVVNAARVSFNKESEPITEWEADEEGNTKQVLTKKLTEADQKLINYLAKHNHWSPFSHVFISFRIKAPIFVARQLVKHTVGLAWNEVSRRYVDSEPEFFFPPAWRKKADNVKQGSSEDTVDIPKDDWAYTPKELCDEALGTYKMLLKTGVCPEQARMALPQNTFSEWIWSGSLYAFARVCKLRLDSHTQRETQEVAKLIAQECAYAFPYSWKALMNDG